MEMQIRYRENVNTQNAKVGMFRVPNEQTKEFQKDALYKMTLAKVGEPEKAKQGRKKKNSQATSGEKNTTNG